MRRNIKNKVINSLNMLLQQYPFEKITVEMITDGAEISKATFYRYFKDKQEVLCCNWDRILADSIEKSHSIHDLFYNMTIGYGNLGEKLGKAIVKYTGDNNYTDYIIQKSMDYIELITRKNRSGKGLTEDEHFQCSILMNGIARVFPLLSIRCSNEQACKYADLLTEMVPDEFKRMEL